MRLLMSLFLLAGLATALPVGGPSPAGAQECSGENCPPPQSGSGHDCERKKQEDTVS
ncbi:hypothetical protein [Mesorhizobium sp. 10J20-29]|jgi:hypothetical protein